MARYIGHGSHMGRPAEDNFCCWPTCNANVDDFPLCKRHQIKVYVRVQDQLSTLGDEMIRYAKANPRPDGRTHRVYFVRYRDRIKIGYSIDPRERIKAHPVDEILAVVPGGRAAERAFHLQWAHLRENGEWFRAEQELLEYARGLADEDVLAELT
jgi:hypothetical protein